MDRLRTFLEDTTIHGLKDFLRINYAWARWIWILFVCSCFGMMTYEMIQVATEFAGNPTATQVRQERLESYEYPRMLFCTKDWINETKVAQLDVPRSLLIYALSLLQNVRLHKLEIANVSSMTVEQLDADFKTFLREKNIPSYLHFYTSIADDAAAVADCPECEVLQNQVLAAGVCVQLRPEPASTSFLIRVPPGFLYTRAQTDEGNQHLVPVFSGRYEAISMFVSFRPQYDFFSYDPILLNANSSYILRIKPVFYIRLNKVDHPCVEEALAKAERYSQLMCYFHCDEMYKARCMGCKYLSYERNVSVLDKPDSSNGNLGSKVTMVHISGNESNDDINRLPVCSTLKIDPDDRSCSGSKAFVKCASQCLPLCREWVYETSVIPVRQRKLVTASKAADVTIVFSYQVRYGESIVEEVSTYSWDTFISNIGGQLGLWMGISAVSLLQLLHFLSLLCYDKYKSVRRRAGELEKFKGDSINGNALGMHSTAGAYSPVVVAVSSGSRQTFRSAFDVG